MRFATEAAFDLFAVSFEGDYTSRLVPLAGLLPTTNLVFAAAATLLNLKLLFPASRPTIVNPRLAAGKKQSVSAAAGALTCMISLHGWDTVSVGRWWSQILLGVTGDADTV